MKEVTRMCCGDWKGVRWKEDPANSINNSDKRWKRMLTVPKTSWIQNILWVLHMVQWHELIERFVDLWLCPSSLHHRACWQQMLSGQPNNSAPPGLFSNRYSQISSISYHPPFNSISPLPVPGTTAPDLERQRLKKKKHFLNFFFAFFTVLLGSYTGLVPDFLGTKIHKWIGTPNYNLFYLKTIYREWYEVSFT